MKLTDYINSLSDVELAVYAEKCKTTVGYLRMHIFYARKQCKKPLREALAKESNGNVSLNEVLQHFGILPDQAA